MGKELISDDVISINEFDETMYHDVWQNSLDKNNRKFVPDEVFETLEDAKEVVDQLMLNYETSEAPLVYAVIRKTDLANMGYVQLVQIDIGYEIGYHIAEKYTNNGYASRAVKLFLEYLRNNTDLKEIYGIALSTNKASKRVLEKNGFVLFFEGVDWYQGKRRKIVKTIAKLA